MTVIQFKRRLQQQQQQKQSGDRVLLAHILLAAVYYSGCGRHKEAKSLTHYVTAHDPMPARMCLPPDLFDLVEQADLGTAMFPEEE